MGDQDQPTADDIVGAARNQLDSNAYQLYNYNDGVPSGVPKDHQFIANVLNNAGLDGFDGDIDTLPGIQDWANPNSSIPGWTPVSGPPQAGDVLATDKPIPTHWYVSPGQSMGIATGDGTTIGVQDNNRVAESDFGLQDGHDPTIWRSTQLADGDANGDDGAVSQLADDQPSVDGGIKGEIEWGKHGPTINGTISGGTNLPDGSHAGGSISGNQRGINGGGMGYQSPDGNWQIEGDAGVDGKGHLGQISIQGKLKF